jgi:peptide/nickel transport system ATP-binding protein
MEVLDQVGLSAAGERLAQYPHQLSGGMRQRVMIAMALICRPDLLIADEPTTALDVTIQLEILHLLARLQRELGMALVLITHDLGIVARVTEQVAVMYAGQIVEAGPTRSVFDRPEHPYTRALLDCIPVPGRTAPGALLGAIPGTVPALAGDLGGCHFRSRCAQVRADCAPAPIPLHATAPGRAVRCVLPHDWTSTPSGAAPDPVMEVEPAIGEPVLSAARLSRSYLLSAGLFRRGRTLHAVDGVDLELRKGEVLGVVGESGCGKTTLARMLLGILPPTGGEIRLSGQPLAGLARRDVARRVQAVFQDPYGSLNPRKTIGAIIGLPLTVQGIGDAASRRQRVREIMQRVGLPARLAARLPAQLSGGQRQRVAIARALITQPDVVVCDEPTSALDVSVQAQILNLLQELRRAFGLTYLLISHNLAVVEHMATRVAVMYLGRVVEEGPTAGVFAAPRHPYTQALLASVLTPEPGLAIPEPRMRGSGPEVANWQTGCAFHPRCPAAMPVCRERTPHAVADGLARVACHLYALAE